MSHIHFVHSIQRVHTSIADLNTTIDSHGFHYIKLMLQLHFIASTDFFFSSSLFFSHSHSLSLSLCFSVYFNRSHVLSILSIFAHFFSFVCICSLFSRGCAFVKSKHLKCIDLIYTRKPLNNNFLYFSRFISLACIPATGITQ